MRCADFGWLNNDIYTGRNQDVTQMTSGAYKKMGTEGNLHQKQASTNVSSVSQPNSAPKKFDDFSAVDANKVSSVMIM